MKTAILIIILVLCACAKPSNNDQSSAAFIEPIQMAPSIETCTYLQALTLSSPPIQITGYEENSVVQIEGMTVSHIDGNGIVTFVGSNNVLVGTYCTLNVYKNNLTSITMSTTPGCFPGWGEGC